MKKIWIVIITMAVEAALLFVVSLVVGWPIMDVLFFGSLLIFGVIWFQLYASNKTNNEDIANAKGQTGQVIGQVKVFRIRVSPVLLGVMLFTAGSFFLTVIYYSDYLF